jgi:hypothetical protein
MHANRTAIWVASAEFSAVKTAAFCGKRLPIVGL